MRQLRMIDLFGQQQQQRQQQLDEKQLSSEASRRTARSFVFKAKKISSLSGEGSIQSKEAKRRTTTTASSEEASDIYLRPSLPP